MFSFYLMFLYLVNAQPQVNLYYTDWISENDDVFFHHCLRVVVFDQVQADVEHLFYCLSEFPSQSQAIINKKTPNFTFAELSTLR